MEKFFERLGQVNLVNLIHIGNLEGLAIALFIFLFLPRLFGKLRLPGLLGIVFAGALLGPHALGLLENDNIAKFFADVGKLFVMFFAATEIDLEDFKRNKERSLAFGGLSFVLPLLAGMAVGRTYGYGWNASVLIGSLLASHTLLAFPILQKLGMARAGAVMVTAGATVLTDLGAILVLALCLSIHSTGFSPGALAAQVLLIAIYVPVVMIVVEKSAEWLTARMSDDETTRLLILFLALIVASVGAELVGLEGIIGAFLAGLAINRLVARSDGRLGLPHSFEQVANLLFIPAFFLAIGYLIDLRAFVGMVQTHPLLLVSIVLAVVLAKGVAALIVGRIWRYSRDEVGLMWSLSLPQVAATLAAALAAYETVNAAGERLIDASILNAVIVLMLVTVILGPILTELYASRLKGMNAAPPA